MSPGIRGSTVIENAVFSEWQTQICFLLFSYSRCFVLYFISSEGHEPQLERGKQKTDVAKSEKMKGNCKTQIKTSF